MLIAQASNPNHVCKTPDMRKTNFSTLFAAYVFPKNLFTKCLFSVPLWSQNQHQYVDCLSVQQSIKKFAQNWNSWK